MKTCRSNKQFLSIALCIVILLTLMPVTASAQEKVQTSTEVLSLREENVKHFDMGDGTYQAIAYSHPIHEKDSEGKWQDIDFGMTRTLIQGATTYANTSSGTAFAATYTEDAPLFTLSGEGTSISMTLAPYRADINTSIFTTQRVATANATAQVSNPKSNFRTIQDAQNAEFSSTIVYSNVMPNVDLEYIVDPETVKENIVVKNQQKSMSIYFR